MTTSTSDTTRSALFAAFEWVGAYEVTTEEPANDDTGDRLYTFVTYTLEEAFAKWRGPKTVAKNLPECPQDMIDAYYVLRRMLKQRYRYSGT